MRKFKSLLTIALLFIASDVFGVSYSGSLTTTGGTLGPLYLRAKESATYSLSNFGTASVFLEKSADLINWERISSHSINLSSTTIQNRTTQPYYLRFRADSYTDGPITAAIADVDGDILSTVHTHPYQSEREVMQINDQAQAVFPNGISVTDLSPTGDLTVGDDLTVTDDAAVGDDLTVTGETFIANGAAATPSLAFTSDTNTGIYRIGADNLGFATGGTLAFEVTSAQKVRFVDGADGAPSIAFTAGPAIGLYRVGSTAMGVSGILGVSDGAVSAPGLVFSSDLDTGLYRIGANDVGLAAGGVLKIEANATGLGFFAVTPVARPSAYTQTYSTADKTHENPTAVAQTDNTAGTADNTWQALTDPADTPASADALRDDLVANIIPQLRNNYAEGADEINKLVADLADLKQLVNSMIDDDQALGLKQ